MSVEARGDILQTLTQHFLRGFFRLSFLDDAGEDSFVRAMIGVVVANAILAFAAMTRLYFLRYRQLSNGSTPDLYRTMLPTDQLLMIVLPMLLVLFVMAVAGDSMFPDERDFRVLMPLPISRRVLFAAKAAALFLFVSFFVISSNLVFGMPFAVLSGGRFALESPMRRLFGQFVAGIGAAYFAAAAFMAVQGLTAFVVPRHRLQQAIGMIQTLVVCEVALLLPAVLRLPRIAAALSRHPTWWFLSPPGWFAGLERWIVGSGSDTDVTLAILAVGASAVVLALIAGCYLVLYGRFDRISLQARHPDAGGQRLTKARRFRTLSPSYAAVQSFVAATLRRSGRHQFLAAGAFAAGLALAVNAVLLESGGASMLLSRGAIAAPLVAMLVTTIGLRAALLIPSDIRAAWIFRLNERADCRAQQLDAVRATLICRGVVVPALVAFPLVIVVLGWTRAMLSIPLTLVIGVILVDVIMIDWRRIPFTCSVLFGKRPAALTFTIACGVYTAVVIVGAELVQNALYSGTSWCLTLGGLGFLAVAAGRYRARRWGHLPFEFEDSLPDSLQALRL